MEYTRFIKNIIKVLCILTILLIINQNEIKSVRYNIRTKKEIRKDKSLDYIKIYDKLLLVKSGNEKDILNSNYVYYLNNSSNDNYFLAGHNNKTVFNVLYNLQVTDEILYHKNNKNIVYEIIEKKYIDVDDYSIFDKKNYSSLTLITCSFNNQKRYIVICKKKD